MTSETKSAICSSTTGDRKSTRLNSSHMSISYAVFCLKKKKISHSDGLAGQRRECSAGDVAGFRSIEGQNRCPGFGHVGAAEPESGEAPVDVAARANSFHDFLACVAALSEADVRGLDSRLLRNVVLVEIGSEPGNPCFEPQHFERAIANRRAAPRAHRFAERLPCGWQRFARQQ